MRFLTFLTLCLLTACGGDQSDLELTVLPERMALHEAPGGQTRIVAQMRRGDKLRALGQVSNFESRLQFGNLVLQSPWIWVESGSGQRGWALAAALKSPQPPEVWLLEKRLHCYFGPKIAARCAAIRQRNGKPQTDAEFAASFRENLALRDTICQMLRNRAEPNASTDTPEFDWLHALLPGFVPQKIADGAPPYLFADYRWWHQMAQQSQGSGDDLFLATCLAAFPQDSIESFFPAWKFQLNERESASRLGSGQHLLMLRRIEQALNAGDLFRPELLQVKEQILEDITGKQIEYWFSEEKILTELKEIEASGFSFWDAQDRLALSARRPMFEAPDSNGIRLNVRAGGGDN